MKRTAILVLLFVSAAVALITPTPINIQPVQTAFTSPVGIDYHAPSNTIITSVFYEQGGYPYNFERVLLDGSHTQFSVISGLTDEVKIATVRPGNPNWPAGTLFVGTGIGGRVMKIESDGNSFNANWAVLPSYVGLMRGSLYVDQTGVWNYDLIVCTEQGYVYRIDANGVGTEVGHVFTHLEGLIVAPNTPEYGDLAGRVIAGAENEGNIYTWSVNGAANVYYLGINVEDLDLSGDGENFFGVAFGRRQLMAVRGHQFPKDAIIATQEFPFGGQPTGLYILQWDVNHPVATYIPPSPECEFPSQWEHVTFAPAPIPNDDDCLNKDDMFYSASGFNLFSLGSFSAQNNDVEGRVAVAGNVDSTNFAFGSTLYDGQLNAYGSVPCNTIDAGIIGTLIAGGSITLRNAEVRQGSAFYGSSLDVDASVRVSCGAAQDSTQVNFGATSTQLSDLSDKIAALDATGTASYQDFWKLNLTCSGSNTHDVFDLTGIALSNVHGYFLFDCHPDASIFINCGETSPQFGGGNFDSNFVALKNHIIWNFSSATSVGLQGNSVQGSILAPHASLSGNGNIEGQVIVGNFQCYGNCPEVHQAPFQGCIPLDATSH